MLMFRRRNVVAYFEEQHAKTLASHSVLSCRRMCTRTNSDNRVPSRFGHHVVCANIRYTADQSLKKTSVPLTFIQIIMSFTGSVSLNPPPTHLFLLFGILSFKTQIRGGDKEEKQMRCVIV